MKFGCARKEAGPSNTETDLKLTTIILRLLNVQKKVQKNIFKVVTDIKFSRFKRKSLNTLIYCSMGGKEGCLSSMGNGQDITINLITMKTTTNTGKNQ